MNRAAAAFALLPLLAACASTSSSPNRTSPSSTFGLEGTTWVLTTTLGGMADTGPAKAQIDLRFEAGHASGSSGCNRYSGAYTLEGSSLSFGDLAATQMACPEPIMTIESRYLHMLAEVDRYEIAAAGGTLRLTGPDVELAFRAEPPAADLPLVGTAWRLTTIGGPGGTVSSTLAGTEVDAVFAKDGSVSGSDGCNSFGGPYAAGADGTLTFGALVSTTMGCAPAVMDQAHAFTTALAVTATYAIDGTTLTLSDTAGTLLLAFDAAAAPAA
ncbi:MAG: META domain-containing protein [Planctomycetaceae bacterium]